MIRGDELFERAREQLLRDLERVPDDVVSLTPELGTRTIAESLLHVAAFEFLVAVALAADRGRPVPVEVWEEVKPGLATEVGYDEPAGLTREDCLTRLERVRRFTRTVIGDGDTVLGDDDVRRALEALRERGADLGGADISVLRSRLASHFGRVPVGAMLMAHEEFHRGQILLQSYLFRQSRAAA